MLIIKSMSRILETQSCDVKWEKLRTGSEFGIIFKITHWKQGSPDRIFHLN